MSRGAICRASGLPVIGWKVEPKAWWPELPGKSGEYNPPMVKAFKKVCRSCRKVEVQGLKRYCEGCARTRNRAAYRMSKAKSRFRVQKTGFSPVAAEALTKPDLTGCYGASQNGLLTKRYHDQLDSHARRRKHCK
jgi:hypothetical protein